MKVEETDPLDSAWPLNTFLPSKGVEKEIRAISPLSWPFFPSFPRIRGKTRLVCRLLDKMRWNSWTEEEGRNVNLAEQRGERLPLYPDRIKRNGMIKFAISLSRCFIGNF